MGLGVLMIEQINWRDSAGRFHQIPQKKNGASVLIEATSTRSSVRKNKHYKNIDVYVKIIIIKLTTIEEGGAQFSPENNRRQ